MASKHHNPERHAWRGRSYKKFGAIIKHLKYKMLKWLDK